MDEPVVELEFDFAVEDWRGDFNSRFNREETLTVKSVDGNRGIYLKLLIEFASVDQGRILTL
jgi:hypothetical protein